MKFYLSDDIKTTLKSHSWREKKVKVVSFLRNVVMMLPNSDSH